MALQRGAVRGLYLPDGGRVVVHGWKSAALAVTLAAGALCAAAVFNGFPLVWPDTGSYIQARNDGLRTPFYGYLIHLLHWRWSFWPVVVAQSLVLAHLLWLVCDLVFPRLSRMGYLWVVGVLAALSSAPWYTGFLMPDIFAPALGLSLYLLAFHHSALSVVERRYLWVLSFVSVAVHLSHLLLGLGCLVVLAVLSWVGRRVGDRQGAGRPAPVRLRRAVWLAAPVILAGVAMVASTYVSSGQLGLSPYSPVFLSARLLADGPAQQVLAEECPREGWGLCAFQGRISDDSDEVLWDPDGPIQSLGGVIPTLDQNQELVSLTLRRYPGQVLWYAARNSLWALGRFQTGSGLKSYISDPYPTEEMEEFFPRLMLPYAASRQNQGTLHLEVFRPLHTRTVQVSLAVSALLLAFWVWRRRWVPIRFALALAAIVVINAVLTGSLSTPHHRYGSRVIWLVVFFAAAGVYSVVAAGLVREWRKRRTLT
jgi:hypothetical protein